MPEENELINYDKARQLVLNYLSDKAADVDIEDIRVVWFCKTLKNWKAMIVVLKPGGNFFEITYNGEAQETYLDCYKKIENVRISD